MLRGIILVAPLRTDDHETMLRGAMNVTIRAVNHETMLPGTSGRQETLTKKTVIGTLIKVVTK